MLEIHINSPATAAAVTSKPCCDSAHAHDDPSARYTCSYQKRVFVYSNGDFAIIHHATVAPGFIVQPACAESLVLLEKEQARKIEKGADGRSRPAKTESSRAKAVDSRSLGTTVAAETPKPALQQIFKPSAPVAGYAKRGSNSYAISRLEQQSSVSISMAPKASDAAMHHGIFPSSSSKTAEMVPRKSFAVPSSFSNEVATAKGNKLGEALKQAAESCTAAKAVDEKKAAAARMMQPKKVGSIDDDWEMVSGDDLQDDWEMVTKSSS
ncbi:hypothetical protein LTR36_000452 [Oleoguttula mirabilis]|uniref:Uncharacterized protein n=1 Tax=Oleoguttula mirabilis TaxID=1507867 RepID=A0AAV9JYT7_9PEZI|nr:hypothetical protein LTR36_000452 [Oleoguttula mirabilis]